MSNPDQVNISSKSTPANSAQGETKPPLDEMLASKIPGLPDPNANITSEDDFEVEDIDALLRELDGRAPAVEKPSDGVISGTVVNIRTDGFFVDIGRKSEAFLPKEDVLDGGAEPTTLDIGEKLTVSITGRSSDGYLKLSRVIAERPKNWSQFENAFAEGLAIAGVVNTTTKGGFIVDVGVRAFLPKSRSGVRNEVDLQKLVGENILCRIVQLDVGDENIILDRRVLLEEEQDRKRRDRIVSLKPGMTVSGTVRDIRNFGAFIDLGDVDGLLHISDVSWGTTKDISTVLKTGDSLKVKILDIEQSKRRISVGLKQLTADPWTEVDKKFEVGTRVKGTVTKLKDFGAFVELEPGIEGLIHVSEMSWARRVRQPKDLLNIGDLVEIVVLDIKPETRRIGLGLKQALGDPWANAAKKFAPGTTVEGMVQNLAKFGAFVEIEEGVEGLLHVSDILEDRQVNHPSEVIKLGESIKAVVTSIDIEERRLRLSTKVLKQHVDRDGFIEEHQIGDTVTGRVVKIKKRNATIDLGDGIQAICIFGNTTDQLATTSGAKPATDAVSLGAMLQSAWKSETSSGDGIVRRGEKMESGQVRSFTITKLDSANRMVELKLV